MILTTFLSSLQKEIVSSWCHPATTPILHLGDIEKITADMVSK